MDLALTKLLKNRNITKVAHMCNNSTYSDSRNSVYIVHFFFLFTYFKDISLVNPPNCRYLTQPVFPCLQNSKLNQLLYSEISLCWNSSGHYPLAASDAHTSIAATRIFLTSKFQFPLFCHWSCSFYMTKARYLSK